MAKPAGSVLSALRGRDVHLIFLETYGAVLYDQQESAAQRFRKVISDKAQLENLVATARKAYGKIDIMVCNAAVNPYYGPATEMTERFTMFEPGPGLPATSVPAS